MLKVDFQKIINTLAYEFNVIIKEKNYEIDNVIVANERYFVENTLADNEIGIVFTLDSGLADLNQAVLPFKLLVVSRDDRMELTQQLLFDFILTYTNTALNGFYQRYSTPNIEEEFLEYGSEVRSSWSVNGTIKFIADDSASLTISWLNDDGEFEKLEVLDSSCIINNEPSPQPMSDSYGENITINRINTFSINFSTFATKGGFYAKVLAAQLSLDKKNTRYDMQIDFGNGNIYNVGMVVNNIQLKQQLGENAVVSITMAR